MVAISRVNPNFPIPGIDQSSKGFRDNFSTIKSEIEALQGKTIVLTGDVQSAPVILDSGTGDVVIDCTVAVANVAAGGSNLSIQYNLNGVMSGSSQFIHNSSTGNVGIGTTITLNNKLSVNGPALIRDRLVIDTTKSTHNTAIVLKGATTTWGQLDLSVGNSSVSVNSVNNDPISFKMNNNNIAQLSSQGLLVGIGTSNWQPTHALDIISNTTDIAEFKGLEDFVDHAVRFTTSKPNSSIGLVLEQRFANAVGGIRIDNKGNVSIHSGESMNAQLSTSSVKIMVTSSGLVGIGTSFPKAQLDVNGSTRTRGYTISDQDSIVVDTAFIDTVLDSWSMSQYRSARYTVQITNTATGEVDLRSVLMMHANGIPFLNTIGSVNSAGSLGVLGTSVNGSIIELTINSALTTLLVKLESQYITL